MQLFQIGRQVSGTSKVSKNSGKNRVKARRVINKLCQVGKVFYRTVWRKRDKGRKYCFT